MTAALESSIPVRSTRRADGGGRHRSARPRTFYIIDWKTSPVARSVPKQCVRCGRGSAR